ncbi:MAG: hypothetical protein FIA99_09410 [Ruminiclostridium sp.]|nr:hypothetical protein [Ruminiclostridium sp.]
MYNTCKDMREVIRSSFKPLKVRNQNLPGKEEIHLKNIVITIVVLAIAIGLIVGVIVPIAQHGRATAVTANTRHTDIETNIGALAQPIN